MGRRIDESKMDLLRARMAADRSYSAKAGCTDVGRFPSEFDSVPCSSCDYHRALKGIFPEWVQRHYNAAEGLSPAPAPVAVPRSEPKQNLSLNEQLARAKCEVEACRDDLENAKHRRDMLRCAIQAEKKRKKNE